MILKDILEGLEFFYEKDFSIVENTNIEDIVYNSKKADENRLFIAMRGESVDGHDYIYDAYNRGARIFIVDREVELPDDTIKIRVKNSRIALSKASANLFENPSKKLTVVGVTGTKGKTSISYNLKIVLERANKSVGLIGTMGIFFNDIKEDTKNTTPESYELQRILKNMVDSGIEYVVMEVSSGGIMMERVRDVDFDIALFNNISPDHIGPKEHPTFEHYLECKSRLFKLCKLGIVNIDDKYGEYIINNSNCRIKGFSINNTSDIQGEDIKLSYNMEKIGSSFKVKIKDETKKYSINTPGYFSIYNALAVIAIAKELNIEDRYIIDVLNNINVPGRMEIIPTEKKACIILDYAHNGISLENILSTLMMYKANRIICLIGSVGGRSKSRRKDIGQILSKYADISVLTSDNPDFEDPKDIIDEIEGYIRKDNLEACVIKEKNRENAIYKSLDILEEGDILLLAGKGHEEYQIIRGEKVYFSDKKVVEKYFGNIKKV